MAEYGRQTDEYGNPIRHTDEYGNPVQHPGGGRGGSDPFGATGDYGTHAGGVAHGTTGAYKTDQYGPTGTTGAYGTDQYGGTGTTGAHGTQGGGGLAAGLTAATGGGHHRRSGSSSSSSEDDGLGGRRKKGLKEKIKEKLPGGKSEEQTYGTAAPGGVGYERVHEKKGMMEKIKEKLPGHH